MARYKIFRITNLKDYSDEIYIYLDGKVDFKDVKDEPRIIIPGHYRSHRLVIGAYVEVDLDKVKNYGWEELTIGAVRTVSTEVAMANSSRYAMINASSVDPTALTITQDGIDRINRGEIREFEYKMEDVSGNKHHWIYRK